MYVDFVNYFDNNKLILIFLAGSFFLNVLLLSKNFFKKDSIDTSSDKNLSAQELSNDTVLDSSLDIKKDFVDVSNETSSSIQKQAVQEQVVHKLLDPSKAKKVFYWCWRWRF